MSQRHTAANLRTKVEEIYSSFGIQPWQIFSITVDNAMNVVKAVNLMAEHQYTGAINDEDEDTTTPEEVENFRKIIEEFESSIGGPRLSLLRCGAHTLNLVVNDVIKIPAFNDQMKELIRVAKAYRKSEYRKLFQQASAKLPPLPGVTRWNRHYEMLLVLQEKPTFFDNLADQYTELGMHCKLLQVNFHTKSSTLITVFFNEIKNLQESWKINFKFYVEHIV